MKYNSAYLQVCYICADGTTFLHEIILKSTRAVTALTFVRRNEANNLTDMPTSTDIQL